jgi:hypothetical protein
MKQRIRLTESDLHRIVKESVEQVLSEGWHNHFINETSSRLLRRASDKAFHDMNVNWNDGKTRTKRGAQWKKFSRGAYDKENKEKESICPSVPESELKNMPKDTYVILDGKGRDFYGEFMYGYSGYAGTKEQCTAFVNRYYDKSANWEFLPKIVTIEDYFQHYT